MFTLFNHRFKFSTFHALDGNIDESSSQTSIDTSQLSSPRSIRLLMSEVSLEQKLEKLMRNIKATGLNSESYIEQLILFLSQHRDLVNHAPKSLDTNPLELAISLRSTKFITALLNLNASVRPKFNYLNGQIEHLLKPKKEHQAPTPSPLY